MGIQGISKSFGLIAPIHHALHGFEKGNGKVCHYLEYNSLFVPIYSLSKKCGQF